MRKLCYLLAVLVVFAALAERVWVEAALLAESYRIHELESGLGSMKHRCNELQAEIRTRMAENTLAEELKNRGREGFALGNGETVPAREVEDGRHEAP